MIAIIAMVIFSAEAADIAGMWKGSIRDHIPAWTSVRRQVKAGEYEAPIENAKLEGDKIQLEINIQPGKVTCVGRAAGDEMKLNLTGTQGSKHSLVCKGQK